jgi:cell division protein ZapA
MTETTVNVLGKPFPIKCSESEIDSLQKAAAYLDEKMRHFRAQGITEFEKIVVISALNVVHELLTYDAKKENSLQAIQQRLLDMKNKIERALMPSEQMELQADNV